MRSKTVPMGGNPTKGGVQFIKSHTFKTCSTINQRQQEGRDVKHQQGQTVCALKQYLWVEIRLKEGFSQVHIINDTLFMFTFPFEMIIIQAKKKSRNVYN